MGKFYRVNLKKTLPTLFVPFLELIKIFKESEDIGVSLGVIVGVIGKSVIEKLKIVVCQSEGT